MAKNKIQFTNPYKKTTSTSTSTSSSKGKTSGTSTGTSSSKGYRDDVDYSKELQRADLTSSQRSQLERERQAKINDKYGGVEPVMTGSGKTYSQTYGSGSGKSASPSSSYTPPSPSGSSGYSSTAASGVSVDYHQQAKDAAARGDWDAVTRALQARQAKIDQQGGGDRGTSNAQILAQLQQQYANSYNALSSGAQSRLDAQAAGSINGVPLNPSGWDGGVDYLAQAERYARDGDIDSAYEALMRRGFKMADTGSQGGGTSQDQAYALIQQLYNQSGTARDQYLNEVEINRQRLAEHPTQFGTGTNPALANRRFVSQDGKYLIIYDQNGTPSVALPNKGTYTQYSPEEINLMSQYYNGDESTDFAELGRQIHNNSVVRTGVGRLVDQYGNFASGESEPVRSAWDYKTDESLAQDSIRNVGQDEAALMDILNRINAGESFGNLGGTAAGSTAGGAVTVPITRLPDRTASAAGDVDRSNGAGYSGGYSGGGYSAGDDLSGLLRQTYQSNLDAQLAALRANYEQSMAALQAQWEAARRGYHTQRNQAAINNDLQRQQLAEMGAYYGLNTGAAGQMALGQSEALQNSLGTIGASEQQAQADNALALERLGIGYRGDAAAAQSSANAQMAQALYNEYVRQLEARQAQEQLEEQRAYNRQMAELEYAYKQQAAQDSAYQSAQKNAWTIANQFLSSGVVPDDSILSAAGISRDAAQAMADSYWQTLNIKNAPRTSSSGGKSGGTSGGLTYSQAKALLDAGMATPNAIAVFENSAGPGSYEQLYGGGTAGETSSGGAVNFAPVRSTINEQLSNGNQSRALGYLQSVWGTLSPAQQADMQSLLRQYGLSYNP